MQHSQKLRFGIVGCGSVGPTHAGALLRIADAELVAVADTIGQRARDLARKIGIPRVYGSDRELCADPDIDVVCICTPSGMHADHAVGAMRAGKHVIVEKPMEISLEACDRMISVQRETGRQLSVIHQHRFDPASMLVKQAIDSGKLGRIVLAEASVRWWRKQEYYDSGDWRGTWALDGGGALMNQGVHTVDVLQWLAGGVSSVFGHTLTGAHERIEVEDIAVAALKFRSGAVGTLTATTAAFPGSPVRIDIYGTEGSAVIEGDRLKQMSLKNGETVMAEQASRDAVSVAQGGTASVRDEAAQRAAEGGKRPGWGDAHRAQILDVIAAIRENRPPLIDGLAARQAVEIVLAVYESAKTGRPVEIGQRRMEESLPVRPSLYLAPHVRRGSGAQAGCAEHCCRGWHAGSSGRLRCHS
jgi:UDP-N-acetyl-2-amino-2-deoxyglucuronate dehydrogenase